MVAYNMYMLLFCTTFLVVAAAHLLITVLLRKKAGHGGRKLPPGSMGWPFIGETLQLYSHHPNQFFSSRQKRYGEIFKSHLLGCPCAMLASPEAARFVLVTNAELFKPTYPSSKERLIGPSALFFHQGAYHARLRKLLHSSLSPNAVRRLVPLIGAAASGVLRSWDGCTLSCFHALKNLSFDVGVLAVFGEHFVEQYRSDELRRNYFAVDRGYNSFPNDIPGTLFSRAVKARKRLGEILRELMEERREKIHGGAAGMADQERDLLCCLMEWRDDEGAALTDNQISDNIIGVLFAAQDTTASVLTWIVKYLHDYPKLMEDVKEEQMAVYELNGCGIRALNWAQTRSMTLTNRVLLEGLRMASIISFTFREAVADVEYKGYLIPKGWKVMPLFRNIHHNPDFFPEPQKFDPSRFCDTPNPNTFMPFGNGVHACPGNELAKLQMLVFIHHLVTQYRFQVVESNSEVEYGPFPVPKNGLPVRLWSTDHDSATCSTKCPPPATDHSFLI